MEKFYQNKSSVQNNVGVLWPPFESNLDNVNLFGFNFDSSLNYTSILHAFENGDHFQSGKLPVLITPNVDQIVKYHRKEFSHLYDTLQNARFILPDGQPIIWQSKLKHGNAGLKCRLTGSDFFPQAWQWMKKKNKKTFFILPNQCIGNHLKKEHNQSDFYSPPIFDYRNKKDYEAVLDACVQEIEKFSPEFLMIGLGFPKQEILALDILKKLKTANPFICLLGASFEFYCGTKKRAPKIFQKMGIEFVHRILTEPNRMIKRYLIDDMAFFKIAIKDYFSHS